MNCFLGFSILDRRRKRAETVFSLDRTFFLRKPSFLLTSLVLRIDPMTYTKIIRISNGPMQEAFCRLSYSIRRKRGQKTFSARKLVFFSKKCVFINLWFISEMTLNLPDDCHITFWTVTWGPPYSLLRKKMGQNCISVRKKSFFSNL